MKSFFEILRKYIPGIAMLMIFAATPAGVFSDVRREGGDLPYPYEEAGWLHSGEKICMSDLYRKAGDTPPGRFSTYTPAGEVRAILAMGDSVWIGTEGGLFIWAQGADTVIAERGCGLASITSLASGGGGEIWAGGDAGLSVRRGGRWERFNAGAHPFFSRISDIRHGEGRMWVSTWGRGCGHISADTLTILTRADSLLDDRVTCVAEQSDHTIWIGTESGICRADSFSWNSMRYGSRIPVGGVRDIILTEMGELFISIARQGVARYSHGRISRFGPGQGLPDREIYTFGLDSRAGVWAVGRGGVSTWDGSGWTPLRLPGVPIGSHDYRSIAHDLVGGTYLGTSRGVLVSISRDLYREIELPGEGPERKIGLIVSSGRSLFLVGVKAVYRYDGGFTPIGLPGQWFEGTVTGLIPEPGGGMWLSTRFGILHHTGRGWEIFDRRQGLPTEHFTSIAADGNGELWFGTFESGVLRLTSQGWIHYGVRNGLPDERISSLVSDRSGTVWASTLSGMIARYTGDSWETLEIPAISRGNAHSGIPADSIFEKDPSVRFLPSSGGDTGRSRAPVSGLDGSGRSMFCTEAGILFQSDAGWRLIDIPARRSGASPTALKGTIDGKIWLGTDGDGAFLFVGGSWMRIDSTNGLGDDHVLSIEEDPSGTIWIGTRYGGVTRYSAGY
jgi:ligand-binding sensor domain-containing protein